MAVTWAVSDLTREVMGSLRLHLGTLTATGTTSDDGDAITAAALGLEIVEDLSLGPALDSTSNPENALLPAWNSVDGKIVLFTAHGTPGPTVPLIQMTAGETVTNYSFRFRAIGR